MATTHREGSVVHTDAGGRVTHVESGTAPDPVSEPTPAADPETAPEPAAEPETEPAAAPAKDAKPAKAAAKPAGRSGKKR